MTPSAPARGIDATGTEVQLPVPSEDVVVTDVAGVERKLFAGQPVPRDLVDAYEKEIGGGDAEGYKGQSVEDLEKEVERRRAAGRDIEIEGTGKDGNVVRKDLVTALEADDETGEAT